MSQGVAGQSATEPKNDTLESNTSASRTPRTMPLPEEQDNTNKILLLAIIPAVAVLFLAIVIFVMVKHNASTVKREQKEKFNRRVTNVERYQQKVLQRQEEHDHFGELSSTTASQNDVTDTGATSTLSKFDAIVPDENCTSFKAFCDENDASNDERRTSNDSSGSRAVAKASRKRRSLNNRSFGSDTSHRENDVSDVGGESPAKGTGPLHVTEENINTPTGDEVIAVRPSSAGTREVAIGIKNSASPHDEFMTVPTTAGVSGNSSTRSSTQNGAQSPSRKVTGNSDSANPFAGRTRRRSATSTATTDEDVK